MSRPVGEPDYRREYHQARRAFLAERLDQMWAPFIASVRWCGYMLVLAGMFFMLDAALFDGVLPWRGLVSVLVGMSWVWISGRDSLRDVRDQDA